MAEGVVEIILRAIDEFSGTMNQITQASGGASNIIVQNWKSIALAAGAAGVALEGYARMQAPLIESTNKLATVTGLQAAAIKEIALATANAGLPIKETLKIMEEGASQGLKSGEALKTYATFWDTVGDAAGENSAELANSSVSLASFGISAENASDAAGAYGYILSETSLSISEFNNICARAGPSLSRLGLSIDQVAVIVDKLEEKGVTGRKAITAITDAAKDSTSLDELYGKLGITATGMDTAGASADVYAGKLNDMAKAHDDVLTPLQKLSAYLQEITYKFSGVISAGANLAPILMGVAAVVPVWARWAEAAGLAGGNMKLLGIIAGTAQISIAGLGATLIAVAPYLIAIAAAAVLLYAAWKTNFLGIQDITKKVVDFAKDRFDNLKDTVAKFGDKIAPSIDKVKKAFGEIVTAVDNLAKKLTGSSIGELIGKIADMFGRIIDTGITAFFDGLAVIVAVAAAAIEIVADKIADFVDWCTRLASNPVVRFLLEASGALTDFAGSMVDRVIPATKDTDSTLQAATKTIDNMPSSFQTLEQAGSASMQNLASNVTTSVSTIIQQIEGIGKISDLVNDNIQNQFDWKVMNPPGGNAPGGNVPEGNVPGGNPQTPVINPSTGMTMAQWLGMTPEARDKIKASGNYVIDGQTYNNGVLVTGSSPPSGAGSTNAPDWDVSYDSSYSGSGSQTASPGYHPDPSTQKPLYILMPPGGQYANAAYQDAWDVATGGTSRELISEEDVLKWIAQGVEVYNVDPENVGGGYKGTQITDYKGVKVAVDNATDSLEDNISAVDKSTNAVDENTDSTKTLIKTNTSLSKVLDGTTSATDKASGSLADWNTELVGGTQEAAELATEAVTVMNTNVVGSNTAAAGNISATHEYIGRSSAASASNISGVTDGMFRNIVRMARDAADEVAGATAGGCAGGTCGLPPGLSDSTGGAGSPIVYDGTSSYGGSTIVTGYDYVPIRSTATTSRLVSDRYATSRYAVPAMASGGEVRGGGKAIVGENGAEFVELPEGARVTPLKGGEDDFVSRVANKILAKIGGQSGGRSGDIHLHGVFIADKSGLMKLNKEIEKVKVMEDGRRGRRATT